MKLFSWLFCRKKKDDVTLGDLYYSKTLTDFPVQQGMASHGGGGGGGVSYFSTHTTLKQKIRINIPANLMSSVTIMRNDVGDIEVSFEAREG